MGFPRGFPRGFLYGDMVNHPPLTYTWGQDGEIRKCGNNQRTVIHGDFVDASIYVAWWCIYGSLGIEKTGEIPEKISWLMGARKGYPLVI
jgi:hypothetical protein